MAGVCATDSSHTTQGPHVVAAYYAQRSPRLQCTTDNRDRSGIFSENVDRGSAGFESTGSPCGSTLNKRVEGCGKRVLVRNGDHNKGIAGGQDWTDEAAELPRGMVAQSLPANRQLGRRDGKLFYMLAATT